MGAIHDAAGPWGDNCILSAQPSLCSLLCCVIEQAFHLRLLPYSSIRSGEVRFRRQRTDPGLLLTWQAPTVHPLYDARYGANVTLAWRRCGHVQMRSALARQPHEVACELGREADMSLSRHQRPRERPPAVRSACTTGVFSMARIVASCCYRH